MHNGLIASSLYPIKYLKEFFESFGSSLETNVLLTSMSPILITFFVLVFGVYGMMFYCMSKLIIF